MITNFKQQQIPHFSRACLSAALSKHLGIQMTLTNSYAVFFASVMTSNISAVINSWPQISHPVFAQKNKAPSEWEMKLMM